jgi:hypothetical protein
MAREFAVRSLLGLLLFWRAVSALLLLLYSPVAEAEGCPEVICTVNRPLIAGSAAVVAGAAVSAGGPCYCSVLLSLLWRCLRYHVPPRAVSLSGKQQ